MTTVVFLISSSQALSIHEWWDYGWSPPHRDNPHEIGTVAWHRYQLAIVFLEVQSTHKRIEDVTLAYTTLYRNSYSREAHAHLRFRFFDETFHRMLGLIECFKKIKYLIVQIQSLDQTTELALIERLKFIAAYSDIAAHVLERRAHIFFIERQRWNAIEAEASGDSFKSSPLDLDGNPIIDLLPKYPDGFVNPVAELDGLSVVCETLLDSKQPDIDAEFVDVTPNDLAALIKRIFK